MSNTYNPNHEDSYAKRKEHQTSRREEYYKQWALYIEYENSVDEEEMFDAHSHCNCLSF